MRPVAAKPEKPDVSKKNSIRAETPPAETGPKPKPVDPPKRKAIEKSIRRGVDFLLKRQNKNGSWGSARRPNDLFAPVPGAHHAFRTAVTSLCLSALIESGDSRKKTAGANRTG